MNRSGKSWGWNVCQKLEAMCMDLEGFVCKEPGLYVGNQMQTVGETVKKLYSDVMNDFLLSPLADPTQHIAQFLPSKRIDLVDASKTSVVAVKEDSVDSDTNKSKEAPIVPETCYKTSTSSGVNHSEKITEDGNLINNTLENTIQENNVMEQLPCKDEKRDDGHSAKISCESSESHLDDMSKHEDILCNASSQSDDSEFNDGWGRTDIIDLNLGTEGKLEVDPLMNLKEKCDGDHSAKISCESSESHLDDMSKHEDILCNASSQSNDSEFEDCWSITDITDDMSKPEDILCNASSQSDDSECEDGWGETDVIDLNLGTEEKIEADPLSDTSASEDGWGIINMIDLNLIPEEKIEMEPLMNLKEKCDDDHSAKMSRESSANHFENIFKQEGILCDASEFKDGWCIKNVIDMNLGTEEKLEVEPLLIDASAFEDADCGITNTVDLNLDTEEKKVEPLMNLEENKTLLNGFIDEFDCDSITYQTSELKNSVTCNENKEENGCRTESVDDFSISSFGFLFCDSNNYSTSFTSSSYAISNDTTRTDETDSISGLCTSKHGQLEASMSWSEIGVPDESSTVDFEGVKMSTIDMSNGKKLVDDGKSIAFPNKAGKSKSYKKMIQDVFMSRKRLAKEYKQVAVLYGDFDKESTDENKLANIGTADLPDSEWELL